MHPRFHCLGLAQPLPAAATSAFYAGPFPPRLPQVFSWSSMHNVQLISSAAFTSCDFSGGDLLASSSPFTWTPNAEGDYYFGCSVGSHCSSGMKVKITVKGMLDGELC